MAASLAHFSLPILICQKISQFQDFLEHHEILFPRNLAGALNRKINFREFQFS